MAEVHRSPPSYCAATLLLAVGLTGCSERAAVSVDLKARPPVEAQVSVDKAVATTGDLITYRVEIDYLDGYTIELPEPGADIADFRILDIGTEPATKVAGRVVEQRWYRLRADFVGSYILPPVRVAYRSPEGEEGVIETSEIFVEVESVLPEDGTATDIRDVKSLRRPQPRIPWVWILGTGTLLSALLAFFLWRRARTLVARTPQGSPPHEVAFRELDRLRRTDFSNLDELRTYYFGISEVLRTYIEGRFALNATDLTSEEILSRVDWLSRLGPDDVRRLRVFLEATDIVKYAAEVPSEREIEESYAAALDFVESTQPRDEPPLQEGAAEESSGESGAVQGPEPGRAAGTG